MKAIILAAGYATRLYPLTENTPKPLIKIAGKPVINYILEKIEELEDINNVFVVTNDKFYSHFKNWEKQYQTRLNIDIINDKTVKNGGRLGAIGDVNFVLNQKTLDDYLIIGGDTIFKFSLKEPYSIINKSNEPVVVGYDIGNIERSKQCGVISLDELGYISAFEEKPENPKSTLVSACMYFYPKSTIKMIKEYISSGNNIDNSGNFVNWIMKKEKVRGYIASEEVFDIGSFEILADAKKSYGEENINLDNLRKGIND